MGMADSMEQLIIVLKNEEEIFRDYIELAKKKKEIIIAGHVKELDSITKVEQEMIIKMGKIDHIRTSIIGNLLLELGIKSVKNISELVKYLPEEVGIKVTELRNRLEENIKEIKEINELNSSLIKQSLEYIDFNMNLMMSLESKGSTYGVKADEKDMKLRSNIFDVKI
jgi:hypothetical protein